MNPYDVLGLEINCTQPEIKKRYRKLAKQYHPDLNPNADLDKFRSIQSAYELIKDEEARYRYDNGITSEPNYYTEEDLNRIIREVYNIDHREICKVFNDIGLGKGDFKSYKEVIELLNK